MKTIDHIMTFSWMSWVMPTKYTYPFDGPINPSDNRKWKVYMTQWQSKKIATTRKSRSSKTWQRISWECSPMILPSLICQNLFILFRLGQQSSCWSLGTLGVKLKWNDVLLQTKYIWKEFMVFERIGVYHIHLKE